MKNKNFFPLLLPALLTLVFIAGAQEKVLVRTVAPMDGRSVITHWNNQIDSALKGTPELNLKSFASGVSSSVFIQSDKLQIIDSINVDSVVADFQVRFSFIASGEWQFIGYYNKARNLTVASRKISERSWNYKILPSKVGWDSHNSITMALDRNNCLHLSGNMHNDSLIYFKTEKPFDISTLTKIFPLVSVKDELSSTYPKFIKSAEGGLIYSYRKGGSGKGITISNIYNEETKSFERLSDKPLFDGLGEMSAYATGPRLGPDGLYHVAWLWRDTPDSETNHDLSYARSEDFINWENVFGEKVSLPITPRTDLFTVDPVPVKGGAINGAFSLFFDPDQNPMLAYLKYDASGNSQVFLTRADAGKWVHQQLSDWDYRWDFSGPGSLEFHIKINDARFTTDGKIKITYWHIKEGNGELIADPLRLSLIEDRGINLIEETVYPPKLLHPFSKMKGMSVQLIKVRQPSKVANKYYVLRWETLGKLRFYERREIAVKPSVLRLYKLSEKK